MTDYLHWHSFRELDQASGQPKGSAFRIFKRIELQLQESRDYALLRLDQQRETIENLRLSQRIYASSVNVVLLAPSTESLILKHLRGEVEEDR